MEPQIKVKGRAYSDEEKRAVLDRIFRVWIQDTCKDLRLGQLIDNARYDARASSLRACPDLFYVEDEKLCDELEQFSKRK